MTYFWFRRDLRLSDNTGLFHALNSSENVQCIFIFDKKILSKLGAKDDARVNFIHQTLVTLNEQMKSVGASLEVHYGNPLEIWEDLITTRRIKNIFTNSDYEPYALARDEKVAMLAKKHKVTFQSFKDHVIFEKDEVLKDDGNPYVVFTPYSRKWKALLSEDDLKPRESQNLLKHLRKTPSSNIIELEAIGFEQSTLSFPPPETTLGIVRNYAERRDYPGVEGTSRLSIHFRFGTISIRDKVTKGKAINEKWLNELIWRDFYSSILYHFPHVVKGPFREKYNQLEWRNNEAEFKAWQEGKTGYPIVDAGMRELNTTGWMHNRVRMITASFLTKHLLIDWRWGEAYFAEKLIDFDLSSNNGGWQWAAGCGVDAAPYFRIFNPYTQAKKFDKDLDYINKWIPEYGTDDYPTEIVEHKFARERCLACYKQALDSL